MPTLQEGSLAIQAEDPIIHAVTDAIIRGVYVTRAGPDDARGWVDEAGAKGVIAAYEAALKEQRRGNGKKDYKAENRRLRSLLDEHDVEY